MSKQTKLKIKTGIKAGGGHGAINHNASRIRVKTGVKAGGAILPNHNASRIRVKTGVKAGGHLGSVNHNATLIRA